MPRVDRGPLWFFRRIWALVTLASVFGSSQDAFTGRDGRSSVLRAMSTCGNGQVCVFMSFLFKLVHSSLAPLQLNYAQIVFSGLNVTAHAAAEM